MNAPLSPLSAVSLHDTQIAIGPFMPEDAASLFLWMNDIDAANLDLAFRPIDWTAFQAWLADVGRNHTRVMFAIRKVSHPQILGYLALTNIHAVHRSAELGIRIGAATDRGKGYGQAAVALALKYAWQNLNLHRVQLTVFAHNTRAIASYRASGFEEEGRLNHAAYIDGQWVDVVIMGALRPGALETAVHTPVAVEHPRVAFAGRA
jgi:[ribosomal protein S5]-alanine N-acetyltransferase